MVPKPRPKNLHKGNNTTTKLCYSKVVKLIEELDRGYKDTGTHPNYQYKQASKTKNGNDRFCVNDTTQVTHNAKYRRTIEKTGGQKGCLLYTSPSPRDRQKSRMPSSA